MISNKIIPIKFKNQRIVIECIIYGNDYNNSRNIDLVIDTGATISGISKDIAIGLKYNLSHPNSFQEFETAGGISELPTIIISKISFAGLNFENFEVVCNEYFDDIYIDAVLGLDFLINFDIYINFSENYIEFTERKNHILTP